MIETFVKLSGFLNSRLGNLVHYGVLIIVVVGEFYHWRVSWQLLVFCFVWSLLKCTLGILKSWPTYSNADIPTGNLYASQSYPKVAFLALVMWWLRGISSMLPHSLGLLGYILSITVTSIVPLFFFVLLFFEARNYALVERGRWAIGAIAFFALVNTLFEGCKILFRHSPEMLLGGAYAYLKHLWIFAPLGALGVLAWTKPNALVKGS